MRGASLYGAGLGASVIALALDRLGIPIRAVASRSPERAAALAAQLRTIATTYDELPIDGLTVVATPPSTHGDAAIRVLEAGGAAVVCHPLCSTLADADALVAAANLHDDRLLYAEHLLHAPVVLETLRRARTIHPLTYLEARALQGPPDRDDLGAWGGGALFELGARPIALILLLAGAATPVEVRAVLDGPEAGAHDDHAVVELRFDTGLRARAIASWREPDTQVWDLQAVSASAVVRAEVAPTPGLEVNGEPVPLRSSAADPLADLGYLGLISAFVEDLRLAQAPVASAEFGRRVLEVIAAAYAAAGLGRPVPLPFEGPRDRSPLELWRDPPR